MSEGDLEKRVSRLERLVDHLEREMHEERIPVEEIVSWVAQALRNRTKRMLHDSDKCCET